jgi:PKD repeat protein
MLSVRNPILTSLLLTALLAGCQTEPPVTPANPKPAPEEPADPEAELGVALDATPLEGAAPLRVTFRATATGYTPDYLWDFGDGSAPLYGEATVSHTYRAPGRYTATVSVGSSEALTQDSVSVTVR